MTHGIQEVARVLGRTSIQLDPTPPEGIVQAATVHFAGRPLYVCVYQDERAVWVDCPDERTLRLAERALAPLAPLREGRSLILPDPHAFYALLKGA